MDGKLIIIGLFTILLYNCNNKENIQDNGRNLISQNINILLDSVEIFDIPPPPGREYLKKIEITLGLRDSITIDTIYTATENKFRFYKYLEFNLDKNDLRILKTKYKLFFQKNRSLSIDVLNIEIYNLRINEIEASVDVSKVIGISAIHDRFYFKKIKGVWVFKKKINLGMG